jgi:hypothetical protein
LLAGNGGGAAAVVITGAPGIGKTSVWRAVAGSQPAGVTVLRTTGVAGGQAAFANLADLLGHVAGRVLPGLPGPQAGTLRAALGLAAAEGPLGEMVLERAAVAALGGLAQQGAGVVVAVDDGQWVDADTGRLLEAAAVRLREAPMRWLVAVRSGYAGGLARVLEHELAERVTQVELAGLDDGALGELVLARFGGRWSTGVLRQVVALAAGSPYAALELARETNAWPGGCAPRPGQPRPGSGYALPCARPSGCARHRAILCPSFGLFVGRMCSAHTGHQAPWKQRRASWL